MNRPIPLTTFLKSVCKNGSITLDAPLVLFGARQFPLLFFATLLQLMRKNPENYITVLDLKSLSKGEAQRMLQGSFLGQKTIFWCSSLAELSTAEQQSWVEYLVLYKGPNTIVACAENNDQFQKSVHEYNDIPDSVTLDTVMTIISFLYQEIAHDRVHYFFKNVFDVTGTVSLDQMCLLLTYFQVAGKNNNQFCKEMLPYIVPPQHSLFALSDAFFEKNIKKFLRLWYSLSPQFSLQFWISFWSEQLWRSYFYVLYMKSGRIADAKKIAYRLPYSFTQKSWKKYTLEPFVKTHQALYELDYDAKNGAIAQEAMLELICIQFITD